MKWRVGAKRWVVAALFALGCSDAPKAPATTAPKTVAPRTAASTAGSPTDRATKFYDRRCRMCHGTRGQGDGPLAGTLQPRPRSFSTPGWAAKVTDAHIAKVIVDGGAAAGLSAQMPAHADLQKKPEVVEALVQYVRQLGVASSEAVQ